MLTLREALTRATDQLSAHPELRPTALPDAAILLMHALQIDRSSLIAHPERKIDRDAQVFYQSLIARRLAFEPIQYILGSQEFYGLHLRVTPAVLIPRPETELLVEAILHHLKPAIEPPSHSSQPPRDHRSHPGILDIGTGSGAIAIALAHHLPHARLTAVDLSPEALALAQQNAQAHQLTNINFLQSDLCAAVTGTFQVIVSNPPYIPAAESLHPQVARHEPHTALFAGPDGLTIYRRLIPQAFDHLVPGGLLALEIGYGQSESIARLLTGFKQLRFLEDLQRIPRVALAVRPV